MAFTLGQTINLKSVVTAGLPGVVLGLTVWSSPAPCASSPIGLGGSGIAGAAASSTAGNSAAVRGRGTGRYVVRAVAPAATVQVAASVIVTAILTPLLTAWWYRRLARRQAMEGARRDIEEAAMR